jgi:hypothetical protein
VTTIRENLLALRAAIERQPERLFDMSTFSTPTICGTFYCSLGLAASMPFFNEQGLTLSEAGIPKFGEVHAWCHEKLATMFGEDPYANLFTDDYWQGERTMTDKERALDRINRQLELYP